MSEPALVRAEARVGTTLRGKYRLDSVLGLGGMGAVYAATHRNTKRFAVKILHSDLSRKDDIRNRFLREGYAANKVGHPGTVAVLDDDINEDGTAFLVMELLEGSPVDRRADRCGGRLGVRTAAVILDQLLDVLSAAHTMGVVHRDIKPANLFITAAGMLKVLDFGIARARDAAEAGRGAGTTTGTLLGSPAFMSPEQALAQSSSVDAQTDLWAAAATLYTLVTGQLVHEGDNPTMILVRAATRQAPPLASVVSSVPIPIAAVVDRGLAFAKEARWASALEMRAALRSAYLEAYGDLPSRIPSDDERPAIMAASPDAIAECTTMSLWPSPDTAQSRSQSPRPSAEFGSVPPESNMTSSITPGPLESGMADHLTVVTKPSRRWLLAGGVGVLVFMAVAWLRLGSGPPQPEREVKAHGPGSPSSIAAPEIPTAPVAASTSSAPAAPSPSPAQSSKAATGLVAGATEASARPEALAAEKTRDKPRSEQHPRELARPSPAPRVDCNPPYFIDAQGFRVFKKECI